MEGTPKGFICLAIIMSMVVGMQKVEAQILGPLSGSLMTVRGTLFCSPNGAPCANCPPLVNAMVNLRLSDSTRNISSTITQSDGTFQIRVTDVGTILAGVLGTLINPSSIRVVVSIPVVSCPVLANAVGALVGTPVLRGVANNGAIIELVVPIGTFIRTT